MANNETPSSHNILVALWRNWAISYGCITLPLIVALFVPKIWIPFVCVALAWLLISLLRGDIASGVSACSLVVYLTSRVMLVTAAVMFLVAILCTDWLVPTVIHLDLYNSEIPFITCLVTFPVTAAMCLLCLYAGAGEHTTRRCRQQNGYYAGDSIIATLYYRETRYQTFVLLIVSLTLGAVEYWYYFARYINSDINDPDRFFFNYMPAAMYLLSLLFMAGRYNSIGALYRSLEEAKPSHANSTLVRFLIFHNSDLLLHRDRDGLLDTPAECVIERSRSIPDKQASLLLDELTSVADASMRYLFTNNGFSSGSNVIHYAAFVDDATAAALAEQGIWNNAYMLDAALAANALEPALANELFRIHTMTMAWKTYSLDGTRLYPVRHYRPTFRFGDLKEWEIDYDDTRWFDVAANNEDRLFFRTRRLWHRITSVFKAKTKRAAR